MLDFFFKDSYANFLSYTTLMGYVAYVGGLYQLPCMDSFCKI